jgi:hypothetical protein
MKTLIPITPKNTDGKGNCTCASSAAEARMLEIIFSPKNLTKE